MIEQDSDLPRVEESPALGRVPVSDPPRELVG